MGMQMDMQGCVVRYEGVRELGLAFSRGTPSSPRHPKNARKSAYEIAL